MWVCCVYEFVCVCYSVGVEYKHCMCAAYVHCVCVLCSCVFCMYMLLCYLLTFFFEVNIQEKHCLYSQVCVYMCVCVFIYIV